MAPIEAAIAAVVMYKKRSTLVEALIINVSGSHIAPRLG
jgi:hypothetical protein